MNNNDPTGDLIFPWQAAFTVSGGTPAERQRYERAIERDRATPRGQEIEGEVRGPLFGLFGSARNLELAPKSGENDTPRDSDGAPGDKSVIDPSSKLTAETANGPVTASPERVVAHELFGHAGDKADDDGPGDMNNTKHNENPIVQSLGMSPRTSYDSAPQGSPPKETSKCNGVAGDGCK